MRELKNRLLYLYTGEFAAVGIFTFVYIYGFSSKHSYSLIFVLFVLNFILLQGGFYWLVHWIRLKGKENFIPNLFKLFSDLNRVNIVLLCTGPLIIVTDIFLLKSTSGFIWLLIGFVYAFAFIEYINYFHVQLTNYKGGRGKRSSISKGLKKWRKRSS